MTSTVVVPEDAAVGVAPGTPAAPETLFAHASEAEMARILDFYGVLWQYEPHTFPILWTQDGDVAESFSPDFYLPDLDLYLEMTTLRQKLVRKKNRKLRRLRELYPDVRIKLFYARDFRALMLKYGKVALADALSGTAGHVGPRDPVIAAIALEPALTEVALLDSSAHAGISDAADPDVDDTDVSVPPPVTRRHRRRRRAASASEPATSIAPAAEGSTDPR